MTSICILDRGNDASEWLKQLPDCPAAHQIAPPAYNLAPLQLVWSGIAFVVLCIAVAAVAALRYDYKKSINRDLARVKVPNLLAQQTDLIKRVDHIEKLNLNDRMKKVETLFGSTP